MPLNRPALSVPSVPHSVQQARRWVTETILEIGRPELVETAELGVSELVTNAVLHATDPIAVRVRGTPDHPRVEVRDGSTTPPVMPHELTESVRTPDDESLLMTFGRGLDIVARCADAWGAEIEDTGKVMWFVPAASPHDEGVEGAVSGVGAPSLPPGDDAFEVRILGAPIRALVQFESHYRELRREVRLLSLAHEEKYPLAKSLADLFGLLQREVQAGLDAEEIRRARRRGRQTIDLSVTVSPDKAETMGRFIELLDFADEFCRQQHLLALARSRDQVEFQDWFFGEFVRQRSGQPPRPWAAEHQAGARSRATAQA